VPVQSAGQFTLVGFDHPLTLYQVQKHPTAALPFGSSAADFKPRRLAPFWWLGAAVVSVLVAGTFYWQQQPTPLQASALAEILPQRSQYLQINSDALATAKLHPALEFGIQQSLEQAVSRISGLYVVNKEDNTTSNFKLEVHVAIGVFPKPDQLQFTLSTANQKRVAQWSTEWSSQHHQQNLTVIEEQLVHTLIKLGSFKLLFGAEPHTEVPDSFYQQYLQGLQSLRQGEDRQDLNLLLQAKNQLQIIQQSLPEFRQANRALCHAITALFNLRENPDLLIEAKSVCSSLTGKNSTHADLLAYGRYLVLIRELQQAQEVLLQVLASNPKSSQAYTLLSNIYLADKQPLEAELMLKRAITVQPDYWPAIQQMAVFMLERGQLDVAITLFKKVILLAPDNATALANLGSAYLLNGKLQAAADTYQSALQKGSEPFMLGNLATIYYYLGRLKDAVKLYQQAIQHDPTSFELHGNIADAYRQNGQPDEARLSYQHALQLLSTKPTPTSRELALHAYYLAQQGQLTQSAALMSEAHAMTDQTAEVWLMDAILNCQQGLLEAAIVSAKQAVALGYPVKLLAVDPDLQSLHSQPEFLVLLRP